MASGFMALPPELVRRVCPPDYKDAMRLCCAAKSIQKSLCATRVQVELDNQFDTRRLNKHEHDGIARMQTWASFTTIAISESYELTMEEAAAAGTPGIWWLEGVLRKCTALVKLDLSHNYIEADGARKLAGVIPQCHGLKHLELSTNMIMDEGAEIVANALPHCEALESLNLGVNCIGDEGAAKIAGALGQCTRLTHIDLFDNMIGDEGARRLAGALQHCDKILEMDLRHNEIGDRTKHELKNLRQVYM